VQAGGLAAVAWLVAAVVFFVIAGAKQAVPTAERYAFWMVPLGVAVVSCGWCCWMERLGAGAGMVLRAAGVGLCALWLAVFSGSFFGFLARTGGVGEWGFRTGPVEPKLAVLEQVRGMPSQGRPVIFSPDWFVIWPIAYLALALPESERPQCVFLEKWGRLGRESDIEAGLRGEGLVVLAEFADRAAENAWGVRLRERGATDARTLSFSGNPVVLLTVSGLPNAQPSEKSSHEK
jgi:hypothetical protein